MPRRAPYDPAGRRRHQLAQLEGLTRERAEKRLARRPVGAGHNRGLLLAIAIREGRLPAPRPKDV